MGVGQASPPDTNRRGRLSHQTMEMDKNEKGDYEPLLGYVLLEQIPVAIDRLGHRLVPVKYIDAK